MEKNTIAAICGGVVFLCIITFWLFSIILKIPIIPEILCPILAVSVITLIVGDMKRSQKF